MTDAEVLDAFAFGLAKLFHTPLGQLRAEAAHHRALYGGPPLPQGDMTMNAYAGHDYGEYAGHDYVGQDNFDPHVVAQYRHAAVAAVARAAQQFSSPIYGYFRTGIHEHVPLFTSIDEVHAYQDAHPGYDYAAIFVAPNLTTPVDENLGASVPVSGDASVGHWLLPLLMGLPVGALGGYYYRKWQESHPGKWLPWVSGAWVGAQPWVNLLGQGDRISQPSVGAPWVDLVGASAYSPGSVIEQASRRVLGPGPRMPGAEVASRRRGHALIDSAIQEVLGNDSGAAAYVWYLDPTGGTQTIPFPSYPDALDYNRGMIAQDNLVAVGVFDRSSPHWPNPVGWHTSGIPDYEGVIAAQIARHGHPAVAGQWVDIVGQASAAEITAAIDTLRTQARETAKEKTGRVVGVALRGENRFDPRAWEVKTFRSPELAEDWYERVTGDPRAFLYAAYYDMTGPLAPVQLAEGVGGALAASATA